MRGWRLAVLALLAIMPGLSARADDITATLEATLTHPDIYLSYFGTGVAADGDQVLVGATDVELGPSDFRGRAYLYERVGSSWNHTQEFGGEGLVGSADAYGASVTVLSDRIAVGAPTDPGPPFGALYAYRRSSGLLWSRVNTLTKEQNLEVSDDFARDSAMAGNLLVTGDPGWKDLSSPDVGALYIYKWGGAAWTREHFGSVPLEIEPSPYGNSLFGESVSTDGVRVLAGGSAIKGYDFLGNSREYGAALLFEATGENWNMVHKFQPTNDEEVSRFMRYGREVLVSGTKAFVASEIGFFYPPPNQGYYDGTVYVYDYGTTWTETAKIVALDGVPRNQTHFGSQLAYDNGLLAVSAYGDNMQQSSGGAVYLFAEDTPGTWTMKLKVTPPTLTAGGRFGERMA
ncbi:hypothetical protein HZA57_03975, partial [Candidatus Poribacteria bacterium]|nr:hypothetical protein [Candidatus Poribacteria bacterium]